MAKTARKPNWKRVSRTLFVDARSSRRPWRSRLAATKKSAVVEDMNGHEVALLFGDPARTIADAELIVAAVNFYEQVHHLMWDDEEGEWREIQSGADLIQDLTSLLDNRTFHTLHQIVNALPKCDWCQERFDPNKSTARTDAKHFCSTSCENDFRREGLAAAAAAAADRRNR